MKELFECRELLWMLAARDIKIRYKQSIMGFMWALLMPLVIVFAGVVVRYGYSVVAGKAMSPSDIAAVAIKSLPWAFVVSAIRVSTMSLIGNSNLVTKIYFPREVFPISAVLASGFDFLIGLVALTIALPFAGIGASTELFWVPAILLILLALIIGLAFLLSAASLFFRDVKYLVELLLTFGIFFTPVFYSTSMFTQVRTYLLLNPLAPLFDSLEQVVVLHRPPDYAWLSYSAAFSFACLWSGYRYFKASEPRFAECI